MPASRIIPLPFVHALQEAAVAREFGHATHHGMCEGIVICF